MYGFDRVGKGGSSVEALKEQVTNYLGNRDDQRPLCLFVGTSNPHVLWASPTTFDPKKVEFPPHRLDTPSTREHRAAYYQEIADLDALLGDLRVLTNEHLGDNTLFIHTSDHGAQWPFGKWNLYDFGIRVPFIASWPDNIEPNSKSGAMVSWIDLLPTLIEIGGCESPNGLDGKSFADVLAGKKDSHRDEIFTTHTVDGKKNIFPIRSIRTRDWKLIHNLHPEFAHTNHSDLDRMPIGMNGPSLPKQMTRLRRSSIVTSNDRSGSFIMSPTTDGSKIISSTNLSKQSELPGLRNVCFNGGKGKLVRESSIARPVC